MAATVALAVDAALTAAFSAANTALGSEWQSNPDRISVYRAIIPGTPSNRYAVIYAAINRGSSGLNGIGRDGNVRFQVTCAATAPNTNRASDLCDWLVGTTLDALVGAQLSVSGWHPFTVTQDEIDTFPIPVEVVPGRDTVEQALWFTALTDKL